MPEAERVADTGGRSHATFEGRGIAFGQQWIQEEEGLPPSILDGSPLHALIWLLVQPTFRPNATGLC